MKCKVPECCNETALKRPRMKINPCLCDYHLDNEIKIKCCRCGKIFEIKNKHRYCRKNFDPSKWHCKKCHASVAAIAQKKSEWWKSEERKRIQAEIITKFNKSEKGHIAQAKGGRNGKPTIANIQEWMAMRPNFVGKGNVEFDRENFYKESLNIINFDSVEELCTNFDSLLNTPGVWCIKNSKYEVLDVCETQNIGKEMFQVLRRLSFMKNKTDEEISKMNNYYNRIKIRDMAKEGKLNFILIVKGVEDKEEREMIEAQYAHDTKAKYWNPAPNQKIKN